MNTADLSSSTADQRFIDRLKVTGPSTWLLLALVLLLIVYPFVGESLVWRLILGLLSSAVLIAGAWAASGSRRTLFIAFALTLPALVLQWAWATSYDRTTGLVLGATMMLFYVFTFAHVLAYVLRPGPVTGNKLHAAIAGYIILGLLWGFVYTLLDTLVPGSFDYMGNAVTWAPQDWRRFVFFSFVTLTATGYGGMIPVSAHAQSATVLEQLAGTFYIAVLIARLAGLYQPGASRQPQGRANHVSPSETRSRGKE